MPSPMQQQYEQPIGANIADYLGYGTKALQGANTLSSFMGNGSLYNAYPALGLFGPLAGLASGALRGGDTLPSTIAGTIASPGLYSTLGNVFGSSIFGGAITPAATGAATAAASAAPAVASGLATSLAGGVTSLGAIAGSIDAMIHDNTAAKAMKRNAERGIESRAIMDKLASAISSGNLSSEVVPGVRAGDLLRSISAAASRGDLMTANEGIVPMGQYQTLAERLGTGGYRDIGPNGLNGLPGIKHANTLGAFIGGLDDRGETAQRQGLAYGKFQDLLDSLSAGLPSAFDATESLNRSRQLMGPLTDFRTRSGAINTPEIEAMQTPQLLQRYVNDPGNWRGYDPNQPYSGQGGGFSGSPIGMAFRAARGLDLVDPNLRQNIEAYSRTPGQQLVEWADMSKPENQDWLTNYNIMSSQAASSGGGP